MIPSLIVLAMAAAAPSAAHSVPAAALEMHFMCGKHVVEQLVLTAGALTTLQVPDGCPDHGASWSLSLSCAERCQGEIADVGGKRIASVDGPAKKEEVLGVTAEPNAPATVG